MEYIKKLIERLIGWFRERFGPLPELEDEEKKEYGKGGKEW